MAAQPDANRPAQPAWPTWPVNTTTQYDPAGVAGKTILITGGASGFGAAFARTWAKHGAHIIIGDVNMVAGEELVAELRTSTGSEHHHFQHCDVTNWQSQVELFKLAARVSPTGGIDCVVPNAGIGHDGSMPGKAGFEEPQNLDADKPPAPKFKVIDVNLTGVMYTVHLALFWLPRNTAAKLADEPPTWPPRDRHILLIGSIASLLPLVGSAQYTASKHALTGLFRSLRGTAFYKGIRVNMICPYFVDTNLVASSVLFFLAGSGLAELSDVVDAASRFVADQTLIGRAVVIGPRIKVEDGKDGEVKLVEIPGMPSYGQWGKGVWDCYIHDYEHAEAIIYRYTRLLLGLAKVRGWFGWAKDVVSIFLFRRR
jgi:NAD(P)-dependent dehydrogenase (short-subunit alcohol dehydrogenase family)